jgi:hypothetical protein
LSLRPLPDNTQHSQETDIHALGGIRTHNPSNRAAVDPRLRPRDHWDRLLPIASINRDYAQLDHFTSAVHSKIRKCRKPLCSCARSGIQNVIAHHATEGNLSCACIGQLNLHGTELPAKKPCSIQFRTRIQRKFYTKGSQ